MHGVVPEIGLKFVHVKHGSDSALLRATAPSIPQKKGNTHGGAGEAGEARNRHPDPSVQILGRIVELGAEAEQFQRL